jgi:predicted alpha/beta-hydrolase family hydrolase
MITEEVKINVDFQNDVSGILQYPEAFAPDRGTGVIVAHGAGNDMHTPLLSAFCSGLVQAGLLVMRFNFPYRERGKKAPDPAHRLEATWRAAYDFLREHEGLAPRNILGAGKSMGGRIASQMASTGALRVEKLIFLGYPLHPPGKKEKLRDSHLYSIRVPMLFFAGTRDPLCDLTLLEGVLGRIPAPWSLEVIESGDHSFNVLKSTGISRDEVYDGIIQKTIEWLEPA